MSTRRQLICLLPCVAGASLAFNSGALRAQTLPMVSDKDPQAAALGYASDATKADKAKYPNYAAGQQCSSCVLYQGKAADPAGGCPLFAGRQVSAKSWCSAYAKKA